MEFGAGDKRDAESVLDQVELLQRSDNVAQCVRRRSDRSVERGIHEDSCRGTGRHRVHVGRGNRLRRGRTTIGGELGRLAGRVQRRVEQRAVRGDGNDALIGSLQSHDLSFENEQPREYEAVVSMLDQFVRRTASSG